MIKYEPDTTQELVWMFGERHNCHYYPRCVYLCRGCAQARIEHDNGDEQTNSWPEAHGRLLVGGGRYSCGFLL